jgi:hypothetical protein
MRIEPEPVDHERDDAIDCARSALEYALECVAIQNRGCHALDDTEAGLRDLISDLPSQSDSAWSDGRVAAMQRANAFEAAWLRFVRAGEKP